MNVHPRIVQNATVHLRLMQMDFSKSKQRTELAQQAAALIADHGLTYQEARIKAAEQLFGRQVPRDVMPDQRELDAALLEHLTLFDDEAHRQRRAQLRQACLGLMFALKDFSPYVTGAAWKGIVSEHAHGHLQLFHDDNKSVAIELLNQGLKHDIAEVRHFAGRADIPALALQWRNWPFQLSLYGFDDLRGALKPDAHGFVERGTAEQLQQLFEGEDET
jgi:hypothetical protein